MGEGTFQPPRSRVASNIEFGLVVAFFAGGGFEAAFDERDVRLLASEEFLDGEELDFRHFSSRPVIEAEGGGSLASVVVIT